MEEVKSAYEERRLCFGTVDSWLLWCLTSGHQSKGRLLTDVTNASRTMLMNLGTLEWDPELLRFFGLDPRKVHLPVICSSSEVLGKLDYPGSPFPEVPVAGVLGDQQAALVGQHCLRPGEEETRDNSSLKSGQTMGLTTSVCAHVGAFIKQEDYFSFFKKFFLHPVFL